MIVVGLLVLAPLAAVVGSTLFDLARRRSLRRMALRNIVRRPVEALLVVVGASLGTAIITSAFVVGDTLDTSIRNLGRTDYGPIDEVVETDDVGRLDEVAAAVRADLPDRVDGTLPLVWAPAAVVAGDADAGTGTETTDGSPTGPRAEPDARVLEVDFEDARAFGRDPAATGLADAGATPTGDEAVLAEALAEDLDVTVGDTVEVFAYGERHALTVRDVLPRVGLAGYGSLFVAPGTIEAMAAGGTGTPPNGELLVSNDGGVFDGAAHTDEVVAGLEAALADAGLARGQVVEPVKQDLLDTAREDSAEIRDLFSMLGIFSSLVGVLLLVNLFVMLAEERKSELGMLRAVGMKRNHLVRLFGLEGGLYALVAAGLGALAGVGVGRVLILAVEGIFADEEGDLSELVFDARPSSLLTGALIGLAISLLTVWGTSTRIARLNVIRAIRDLPEPTARRTSVVKLLLASLGVVLGGCMTATGIGGNAAVPTLVGPAVAFGSAVPLLSLLLPRRGVAAAAGAASGLWALVAVAAVPDVFDEAGMEMFVAQGVVLVGAGVALVSQADRAWAWLADRLADRGGLASRLAMAYPLARRVRTGILLAMFSLVIFTMTFMSALGDANLQQVPAMARDASGGWDMWVDSSPTNPLTAADVADDEDVAATATLVHGAADMSIRAADDPDGEGTEPEPWPLSGFDTSWLAAGVPKLSERLDEFPDDRAALEAIAADPSLAVASDTLLAGDGPPGADTVELGDEVVVTDPASGRERTFTLVAFVDVDWNYNGLMAARPAVEELLGPDAVESRMYVDVVPGADAEAVAHRLNAAGVAHGADATTFVAAVEEEMQELRSILRLMQGYLGLGLVIGIAGLGVVMVRAVRERRRQIGVLRAMGFSAKVVRRAFLAEAGFVAVQGIALGIGLGLLVSYQMLNSDVFGDPLPFTMPWPAVAVLLVVPGGAAMLATLAPAAQAAAIRPAAALRIAE
ncbi:MAG TPA: ABC transporter permease [Acidimicrobiales bacterium]